MLRLPLTSLLPPESIAELDSRFGDKFRALGGIEHIAVVTALLEGSVTNQRLRNITNHHSSDLTNIFKSLVLNSFLVPDGVGRGTCYRLPVLLNEMINTGQSTLVDTLFSPESETYLIPANSFHLETDSPHLETDSTHLETDSPHLDRLAAIAAPVKATRKAPHEDVTNIILQLCKENYLSLRNLADLLGRAPSTLQDHYINPMIKKNILKYRYPDRINHPSQGYRTINKDAQ